jgi:ribosomal protein S18 acetylase RimI-like enzyme
MSILTPTRKTELTLRWIVSSDLSALRPLAYQCSALQWSEDDFRECFRSVDTIGKIAEMDGATVGFLIYKLDHDLHEVFIKNVAVAAEWQRKGIGRALIQSLDTKLAQAYERVSALVPETDTAAQFLLRDAGYKATRVFRRWYGEEDAYLMQKTRLGGENGQPAA